MEETKQLELSFIERKADNNDVAISQRLMDGYINGTALCQASGKNIADYVRLKTTSQFFDELSSDMGIPISELNQHIASLNTISRLIALADSRAPKGLYL